MAFSSGFFDAKDRDRVYTAEDFTNYLSSLICNGVLDTYGQCFAVTANNNLTVTIGTGKAWIGGHYFENDAAYALDLSSYVSASQDCYAAIGICCNTDNAVRECSIEVKTGVGAPPTFSSFGAQTYLTIAAVHLAAGTGIITSADIIDFRADETKCGYVKCILGKCGVLDLEKKLAELEKRAAALEKYLGLDTTNAHSAIVYTRAAAGMVSAVDSFGKHMNGLIGIVGLLETIELKEEK